MHHFCKKPRRLMHIGVPCYTYRMPYRRLSTEYNIKKAIEFDKHSNENTGIAHWRASLDDFTSRRRNLEERH